MQKYRSFRIVGLMIVFVLQLRVSKLTRTVENKIRNELTSKSESYSKILQILKTLDRCSIMDKYSVDGYVGSGAGTAVVGVTNIESNLKYVAKVVLDIEDSYEHCRKDETIEKLNKDGVSYINKVIENIRYTSKIQGEDFYSCVLILEKAEEALDKNLLFSKKDGASKIENSKKLVRFFGRVIQSFAELHVKSKVLHGDVRPANIMINKKEISKGNFDFIPVIIDFGLRMINTKGEEFKSDILRYSEGYRLPQMVNVIKITGKSFKESWESNWSDYKFTRNFIEDVYALGKTIENVIHFHADYVDKKMCEMLRIRELYLQMTQRKEGADNKLILLTQDTIPEMKLVLAHFLDKINNCVETEVSNKGLRYVADPVNQEFLKQAAQSLSKLKAIAPII